MAIVAIIWKPRLIATIAASDRSDHVGRFPLDEFLRAKRPFLLSHELSAGTDDGSIQFKQ